jgi:hypothetical protein
MRDVSRLAAAFKSMPWHSRPMSRSSRAHARLQSSSGRLIAVLAAAALLVSAQASDRVQRGGSADAARSVWSIAALPVSHAVLPHRLALRSTTRRPNDLHAALPAAALTSFGHIAARDVRLAESGFARAPLVARGYDATAPPALT